MLMFIPQSNNFQSHDNASGVSVEDCTQASYHNLLTLLSHPSLMYSYGTSLMHIALTSSLDFSSFTYFLWIHVMLHINV